MILVPRKQERSNCCVGKNGATYGEIERNLCPLLIYIGEKAGLFVGYKLVSQSCGRDVGAKVSQKARQCKIRSHSA